MKPLDKKSAYNIAIVGATGAVGKTFLNILEERNFPINCLKLLASNRSIGKKLKYINKDYTVEEITHNSFQDIDIALFSAGSSVSLEYVQSAIKAGATVIDNSSAFRMDSETPLVIPEVNPKDIWKHKGVISNPNCTTIIMLLPLKPLHDYAKIKRVVVSSYQATSGAGAKAMEELITQTKAWANNKDINIKEFPHQILFNIIPQVDSFTDNGYTKEEMKMYNETQKILHSKDIKVSATCVRVPVLTAHSESIFIETEKKITAKKAKEILEKSKGIKVIDDIKNKVYPMPIYAAEQDLCYVGRIREDISIKNGLTFWISGDQLRKGAATNAIQIAELLIDK